MGIVTRLFRRKSVSAIHKELRDAQETEHGQLSKSLNLFDLVCFGIAAIVGAGIFSTIGSAAYAGGPAVCLLFILTAITCLFSALCYAEFAARVPVSGSAYTYAYAAFGELVAWIIGWDLLMEYAIGNSVIAFSWSDYFSTFLRGFNIDLPDWLENDFYSCSGALEGLKALAAGYDLEALKLAYEQVASATSNGMNSEAIQSLPAYQQLQTAYSNGLNENAFARQMELVKVWQNAPHIGSLPIIFDLPALSINVLVTALVYIGIKESKTASNMMVLLKIAVVIAVILIGAFYVQPSNWSPFAPNDAAGVLSGIAAVFFAYIGFDAISTTAEECKNPQRDLPRATVITLVLCTILYVAIALVLTGMVSYKELNVGDPLAYVFEKLHLNWLAGIVSLSAIVAITSVFLVFQIGQPRIWMCMARDGLLPSRFARIHPRFKTPAFSTVITGVVVALPILFLNQAVVTDICSIGTLFAFMLVSAGVLALENQPDEGSASTFRIPYINGRWFMVALSLAYTFALPKLPANHQFYLDISLEKFPYFAFYIALLGMTWATWQKKWSLIPVLGVISNLYLIAGLGHHNWLRFLVWCVLGLVIYFGYGIHFSKLNATPSKAGQAN